MLLILALALAEAGGSLNLRSTWSTEQVTEETLPPQKNKNKREVKNGPDMAEHACDSGT